MSEHSHEDFPETQHASLADVLAWAKESNQSYDAIRELEKVPARLAMIDDDIGMIPADLGYFDRHIAPSSYGPVARRAKDLAKSRSTGNSRVRALLRRFHEAQAGAGPERAGRSDWDRLIELVQAHEGFAEEGARFAHGRHRSLFVLRARANCAPQDLDQSEIERISGEISASTRKSLRKALRLLAELRVEMLDDPDLRDLLPADALRNPRPSGRATRIVWDSLPLAFRNSVASAILTCLAQPEDLVADARDRMAAGEDAVKVLAELEEATGQSGRRLPTNLSAAESGYQSAIAWLVRAAEEEGLSRDDLTDLASLMTYPFLDAACRQQIARSEASDALRDPKSSQTLKARLTSLRTLAAHGLRDPSILATVDVVRKLHAEHVVEPGKQKDPEAERVCKILQRSPEAAARFVNAPSLIAEHAETEISAARASGSKAREISALRRYEAAVLAAIQLSRPVRPENLIRLRYRGSEGASGHLTWVKKKSHAELRFPVGEVKNDRTVTVHVMGADAAILWRWMTEYRARFLELRGIPDTPYVIPGTAKPRLVRKGLTLPDGCLAPSSFADLWRMGTAVVGLDLNPHQARHAVATLVLAIYPGNFALVAAILGDTEETVRKHYGRDSGEQAAVQMRNVLLAKHPAIFRQLKKRIAQ
ncbi:hypothetical protein [Thioclava sp. F36-7]|uniref:hypothetical protein n=1 Tax=Thioclava sp. F36-7 TaxID=1915317 RepID=UPI0009962CB5|nr:hypothetical protein [Thioclava sp. F36-7]OOY07011.1 hypothetical protein BMI89_19725 [Thioclava sp. F36-7]